MFHRLGFDDGGSVCALSFPLRQRPSDGWVYLRVQVYIESLVFFFSFFWLFLLSFF